MTYTCDTDFNSSQYVCGWILLWTYPILGNTESPVFFNIPLSSIQYSFILPNIWILCTMYSASKFLKFSKILLHQFLNLSHQPYSIFLNGFFGLLGWSKSNCSFCIVEICHLILEYILNKYGYVIYHFNAHFLLFFANDLLLVYFVFILNYGNDTRQKANLSDFLIWVQNGL